MTDDLNRIRRYELKYLVTEEQAAAIREFIRPIFALDSHIPPGESGYTVNNLYLDTPDLRFYQDVKLRKLTRRKPRVRYYGQSPEEGIWLEVKNKQGRTVWKHRRRVALAEWPDVLRVPRGPAGADTPPGLLRTFEDVTQLCGAEPVLHVRYFREPWVSQVDDYGRVTFDRRLRCRLANGSLDLRAEEPAMEFYDDALTGGAWGSLVVLEIKVEPKVPW